MSYSPVLGSGAGLELEITNLTESGARNVVEHSVGNLRGWQIHHDGSTQRVGYAITGLPFCVREFTTVHSGSSSMRHQVQTGAEIVSPILDTSKPLWKTQVEYLCEWLRSNGHELPGTYTSTHVHISAAGLPLYVLKNLVRIWSFIEAPMFRLSVAELGFHRGVVRKEYAYCRPMSSPLVVFDQDENLRSSFYLENLMKATTLEEFFLGYGACNPQAEPIRYHPARYSALNLLPLLTIGTVEFRVFNESVDPRSIISWVEVCKAIVNTALTTKGLGSDDYPQLPLGYSGDYDLGMFQTLFEMPDDLMYGVERLWNLGQWPSFDGVRLFNSNNENIALSWNNLKTATVPPLINGQPVMMYAPLGSGRNSEDMVFVFHDYRSYREATSNSPVSVEEGRALVRANFRQDNQEQVNQPVEVASPQPAVPQSYRDSWGTWTSTSTGQTGQESYAPTPVDPMPLDNPTMTFPNPPRDMESRMRNLREEVEALRRGDLTIDQFRSHHNLETGSWPGDGDELESDQDELDQDELDEVDIPDDEEENDNV